MVVIGGREFSSVLRFYLPLCKVTNASLKLFRISKPSIYNSNRNLGDVSVFSLYCLVWGGVGDDRLLFEYWRSNQEGPPYVGRQYSAPLQLYP